MIGADRSLLSYLDAPVVIGDPEGRLVFVNPAFAARFGMSGDDVRGRLLAELFEGGAREAVLRAVAAVCEYGESVRFRMREQNVGFAALASPIVADGARVGVVILFKEEVEGGERLMALHREMRDALDQLSRGLERIQDQSKSREQRVLAAEARRATARLRRACDELGGMASGQGGAVGERFDPAELLRDLAARVRRASSERPTRVAVLAPASLPPLRADLSRLENALMRFLRSRIEDGGVLTLGGRVVGTADRPSVLLSVIERAESGAAAEPPSPLFQEEIAALGGIVHGTADPVLGRATLICFATEPAVAAE